MTHVSRREALRLAAALAVVAITTSVAAQQAGGHWRLPSDTEIRGLIAARNAPRPGQGIVIGLLGPEGARIVAGGTGAGAGFEIGSITKVTDFASRYLLTCEALATTNLGYFDDETCRLEPIENPFGPKVLPMSPE